MNRLFLVLAVTAAAFSAAHGVKEWKNFANGKVYSHITPNENKEGQDRGTHRIPATEERFLHSHHRDKKARANSIQTTDSKPQRGKNLERHHRKSVEEEMGLRPLNERHHKFPNPVVLSNGNSGGGLPDPLTTTRGMVQQNKRGKGSNRKRQHGHRMKRNRGEQRGMVSLDGQTRAGKRFEKLKIASTTEFPDEKTDYKAAIPAADEKIHYTKDGYPLKISSYW